MFYVTERQYKVNTAYYFLQVTKHVNTYGGKSRKEKKHRKKHKKKQRERESYGFQTKAS